MESNEPIHPTERDLSLEALIRPYDSFDFFQGVETGLDVFGEDGSAYRPRMAWMLAEASMLAYARDEELVRRAWDCAGCSEVFFFDGKGAQGYLASLDNAAVLVFRGTEPDDMHDVLADMKFMLVPHESEGLVHQGFVNALHEVWGDIAGTLAQSAPRPIWISGHSLGAALALLAGAKLGGAEAVYTYGAPRVGSRGFRNQYPCPVYRIVNNNDIVTMIPPPFLYRHVGELWFIDHEGLVFHEDEARTRDRVESRIRGHIQHTDGILKLWRERDFLSAIPNQNVTDHAPINYVRPLRRAMEESGLA